MEPYVTITLDEPPITYLREATRSVEGYRFDAADLPAGSTVEMKVFDGERFGHWMDSIELPPLVVSSGARLEGVRSRPTL